MDLPSQKLASLALTASNGSTRILPPAGCASFKGLPAFCVTAAGCVTGANGGGVATGTLGSAMTTAGISSASTSTHPSRICPLDPIRVFIRHLIVLTYYRPIIPVSVGSFLRQSHVTRGNQHLADG